MRLKTWIAVAALVAAVGVAGCATAPTGTPLREALPKLPAVDQSSARVFFYRSARDPVPAPVQIAPVSTVNHFRGTTYFVDVPPGKKTIRYRNTYAADRWFELTFDAEPGKTYSVRVEGVPWAMALGAQLVNRIHVHLKLENGAPPDGELSLLGRRESFP